MSAKLVYDTARVVEYTRRHVPFNLSRGMHGIGLERNGEMAVGIVYENFNGVNCWAHIAATGRGNRDILRAGFIYPFVQLGLKRISGMVEASNTAARELDEHLGFKQEAVLRGAASDGGDVLLYVMRREDCKYV